MPKVPPYLQAKTSDIITQFNNKTVTCITKKILLIFAYTNLYILHIQTPKQIYQQPH